MLIYALASSEHKEVLIFAVFDVLCVEGLYTHELVNSSEFFTLIFAVFLEIS